MQQRLSLGLIVGAAAFGATFAGAARADDWNRLLEEKRVVWGGDQEGGGPYIYPQEDRPEEVTGFEVELAP